MAAVGVNANVSSEMDELMGLLFSLLIILPSSCACLHVALREPKPPFHFLTQSPFEV